MIKVYDTDSVYEIAHKIYYDFEVHMSCSIYGFMVDEDQMKMYAKGELVWKEIEKIDTNINVRDEGAKRRRNYKYKKESIGGPIAQKIFTKDVKIIDNVPRWTIWRYQ